MATSRSEASTRSKRAPVPSHKLTDASNSATPELTAHAAAIALKRAVEAQHLPDKNAIQATNPESSTATPAPVPPVPSAKRPRSEPQPDLPNRSSDPGNDSDGSAALSSKRLKSESLLF